MKAAHYVGILNHEIVFSEGDFPDELPSKERGSTLKFNADLGNGKPAPGDRVIEAVDRTLATMQGKLLQKRSDGDFDLDEHIERIMREGKAISYHQAYGPSAVEVKVNGVLVTYELEPGMCPKPRDSVLVPMNGTFETGEVVSIFRLRMVSALT